MPLLRDDSDETPSPPLKRKTHLLKRKKRDIVYENKYYCFVFLFQVIDVMPQQKFEDTIFLFFCGLKIQFSHIESKVQFLGLCTKSLGSLFLTKQFQQFVFSVKTIKIN